MICSVLEPSQLKFESFSPAFRIARFECASTRGAEVPTEVIAFALKLLEPQDRRALARLDQVGPDPSSKPTGNNT
jgi:hypothetical protein